MYVGQFYTAPKDQSSSADSAHTDKDSARPLLTPRYQITRARPLSVCGRHLLRRSHHARYRRVRLFRVVQVRPPPLLRHFLLQQPEPLPHKLCPAPRCPAGVAFVCRLTHPPAQRIVTVVRFRVAADDPHQLPLRAPFQLLATIADNNEGQELREQLYQAKQVVKGIKDSLVWWAERRLNNKKAGKI